MLNFATANKKLNILNYFSMRAILLRNVKNGDYFTLRPLEEPKDTQVYVRGDYDRDIKKYEVSKFADINDFRFLRGDRIDLCQVKKRKITSYPQNIRICNERYEPDTGGQM